MFNAVLIWVCRILQAKIDNDLLFFTNAAKSSSPSVCSPFLHSLTLFLVAPNVVFGKAYTLPLETGLGCWLGMRYVIT